MAKPAKKTAHPAIKAIRSADHRTTEIETTAVREETPVGIDGHAWLTHSAITSDPHNARKVFDAEGLDELAASMEAKGLLQAPAVRPARSSSDPEGSDSATQNAPYILVLGERRWRAWGLLIERGVWPQSHAVLCPVVAGDATHAAEAGLIENLQRRDLKPLEEARAFQRLVDDHGHTTQSIADAIGFGVRMVQQRLQLLDLKPHHQEMLEAGKINIEQARKIVADYPAPIEIEPANALAFLEIAHHLAASEVGYFYADAKIGWPVDGAAIEALDAARLIKIRKDWDDGVPEICMGYGDAARLLRQLTGGPGSLDLEEITPALNAAREAAGAAPWPQGGYTLACLNAPFAADPEQVAAIAERDAEDKVRDGEIAEEPARRRAAREAETTAASALMDLARQCVAPTDHWPAAQVVAETWRGLDAPLPWAFASDGDGWGVTDANGDQVDLDFERFPEAAAFVMTLVNRSAGFASAFSITEPDADPGEGDTAGEPAPERIDLDDEDAALPDSLKALAGIPATGELQEA